MSYENSEVLRRRALGIPTPSWDELNSIPTMQYAMPPTLPPEIGTAPQTTSFPEPNKVNQAQLPPFAAKAVEEYNKMPAEYRPTILRRILSGIAGGLAGYEAGKDVLLSPQTERMKEYKMRTEAAKAAAGIESGAALQGANIEEQGARTIAERYRAGAELERGKRERIQQEQLLKGGGRTTSLQPRNIEDPEDPTQYKTVNYNSGLGTYHDPDTGEVIQEAKLWTPPKEGVVPGEIIASVGPRPKPDDYEGGIKGIPYRTAMKGWGDKVEAVKLNRLKTSAWTRGQAFGEYGRVQVLDVDEATGNITQKWSFAGPAIRGDMPSGSQAGARSILAPQATMGTIKNSLQMLKEYTPALDKEGLAIKTLMAEPGWVAQTVAQAPIFGTLSREGQGFMVHWLNAREQIINLRQAGSGAVTETMRKTILQNLPSPSTPNSLVANQLIDRQLLDVDLLEKGIPNVGQRGGGPTPKVGEIKTFPNGNKAKWDGKGWLQQ